MSESKLGFYRFSIMINVRDSLLNMGSMCSASSIKAKGSMNAYLKWMIETKNKYTYTGI